MTDEDPGTIDDTLTKRATEFDAARVERGEKLEKRRNRGERRVRRMFWFLFALVLFATVLLAYRYEVLYSALKQGLYDACQARADQGTVANEKREAFIQLVLHNPDQPVPPDKQEAALKNLRDALLVPVEDCGPSPSG